MCVYFGRQHNRFVKNVRFPEYETQTSTLIENQGQNYAVTCVPPPLGMAHPQVVVRGAVICEPALYSSPVTRVGNSSWSSLPLLYQICRVRIVQ